MINHKFEDKDYEMKFNYAAFFKANTIFSSRNKDTGEGNDDGAAQLWVDIVTGNDTALYRAFRVLLPSSFEDKLIYKFIDSFEEDPNEIVLGELQNSRFFVHAVKRWVKLSEAYVKGLKNEDPVKKSQLELLAEVKKSC